MATGLDQEETRLKFVCALAASLFFLFLSNNTSGHNLRDQIIAHHFAYVPSNDGRFPTLVAIPGCSGISSDDQAAEDSNPQLREDDLLFRRHYRVMAERFRVEGYAVLLINIHTAERLDPANTSHITAA